MAVNVNPPPQFKLPKKFLEDPEIRGYFKSLDWFLWQMFNRTGGGNDAIETASANVNLNTTSIVFDIMERIGSGINVTIDTTGFTIDTTEQTTDQTEQ
jgi:hypothetical protein